MIEANPFNKCKECVHEYCGQANMPCRACTFGSKFERAFIIPKFPVNLKDVKLDVTKLVPTEKIIENVDKHSVYPDTSIFVEYCKHDVETTKKLHDIMNRRIEEMKGRRYIPEIKNVEFNPPLTVVIWEDGTKTFVKAHGGETFDPEKGLAMAICKKLHGNKYSYTKVFDRWIDKYEKKVRRERFADVDDVNTYANDIQNAAKVAGEAVNKAMQAISDAVNNKV